MPIFRKKNKDFFKRWSPEMAYVLGFFAADGNMLRNKRGAHFIEFQITDKNLLEEIRGAMRSRHKITARKRKDRWKTIYRLQLGSKTMFADLLKRGMVPAKSKKLRFPVIPSRYFGDFVRGYFDGDGSVNLGRYWRKDRKRWKWQFTTNFTSGSKSFLQGLWRKLKCCTKGGRLGAKTRGYELVFSQKDSVALFELMYNNSSAKLFLGRKYRIFLRAFKVLKMRA